MFQLDEVGKQKYVQRMVRANFIFRCGKQWQECEERRNRGLIERDAGQRKGGVNPPGSAVDPVLNARLQKFAGTWYTGSPGQCWQLTLSISGTTIKGVTTNAGPFVDTGQLEGSWDGSAFSFRSTGTYKSDGCVTCKNRQGTRTGTGSLRYNEAGPTLDSVFNESGTSENFSRPHVYRTIHKNILHVNTRAKPSGPP